MLLFYNYRNSPHWLLFIDQFFVSFTFAWPQIWPHHVVLHHIWKYSCMIQLRFMEWLTDLGALLAGILWGLHCCESTFVFPQYFGLLPGMERKDFFLSLFIRWVLIQQARKNVNIFSEYLKRVEIGIQPSCPEQLKDWQLSFYPWRNVPWFVTSSHQRQQRGLRNVLRYGIPYHSSQNIHIVHFLITFQKLKEYFINNQGDNMVGLLAKR